MSFEFYDVVFGSQAVADGELFVTEMNGVEGVSELFEFRLRVETGADGGLTFAQVDDLLAHPCYIAFGREEQHKVHGVLREVKMLPSAEGARVVYELSMVPRFWYATQTFGSWVYLDMTVPEIIKDVLKELGLNEGDDYELRLVSKYPKREYTLQYRETDFAFLSRLMEHEGIFYRFDHAGDKDKLVIGDANNAFDELAGHEAIAFDPRGGVTDPQEVVTAVSRTRQVIPRAVGVKDYNWRTPTKHIGAGVVIDATGKGTVVDYGDHFKDDAGAKRYAKIRGEEAYCRRETYGFTGRVRGLRAGHRFALTDHFVAELQRDYIVTQITHHVRQAGTTDDGGNAGYSNTFTAIPLEVQFRPARVTLKPKVAGFIHARIDGPDGRASADNAAPIDDQGRYRVSLMIDGTKSQAGNASHWVRRAQPFSGSGYGMHFPLHVGTEVMLLHVDGDPDRPVIVATVPNPENGTPVTAQDATLNRIRTRSGIVMGFHDKRD